MLHSHPAHRARQLRWVIPFAGLLLVAVLATLAVQYRVSDRAVETEFFRAHKTVHHTSELLRTGTLVGGGVLVVLVGVIAVWAIGVSHRIVRPVHALHAALDRLVGGDLTVRVDLHRADEFQEVGAALDHLVEEFAGTLARVHALSDEVVALAERAAAQPGDDGTRLALHAKARELDDALEFFRVPGAPGAGAERR